MFHKSKNMFKYIFSKINCVLNERDSIKFMMSINKLISRNFTPKCYRLTSLPNCMLSLYKGRENDTRLKAYHYYRREKISI